VAPSELDFEAQAHVPVLLRNAHAPFENSYAAPNAASCSSTVNTPSPLPNRFSAWSSMYLFSGLSEDSVMITKSSISGSPSSVASRRWASSQFRRWTSFTTVPVSSQTELVFSRPSGLRRSTKSRPRVSPASRKPFVIRTSKLLYHGVFDAFSASTGIPPRPAWVGGPVCPAPSFCSSV